MRYSLASGVLAAALGAALTACASPWRLEGPVDLPRDALPRVGPYQAVASATMSTSRGDLDAIAYLASPGPRRVRAHLTTDSGLTIADVEVDGAESRVHAESELSRAPGLLPSLLSDLRRMLGDRSVFSVDPAARALRAADDPAARVALPLADGSWVVASEDELRPASPTLRVTLLDPSRVPEAEIVYEDPGPEGLPRTIRLTDLSDGHALTLDVQQVLGDGTGDASGGGSGGAR